MNEKEKELIKSLAALFNKLKKLIQFGSAFFHPPTVEEDKQPDDVSDFAHPNINLLNSAAANDATGENAIGYILKNGNLTNKDN
ncbi:MAG TPA: hypothetical protein VJY62_22645 [Bacteroidia bacterium]|nr:hypothetical protein [Bacteroidia bacterium]